MIRGVHADGVWKEEPLEVKEEVWKFFKQRFNEDHWDRPNLDGVAFEKISSDDNDMLLGSFGKEEIVEAIQDCRSSKSLNPDGYNFKFKKEFWTLMKEDVINFFDEFHTTVSFIRGINVSFIALIPKVGDPQGWRLQAYIFGGMLIQDCGKNSSKKGFKRCFIESSMKDKVHFWVGETSCIVH